jgi:hypothetical protein
MFKEWHGSGLYGPRGTDATTLIRDASEKLSGLRPSQYNKDFGDILGTLKFATDELRHHAQFAEILANIVTPSEKTEYAPLSEGVGLTELRYAMREDSVGLLAVRMSESAGLSFFFGTMKVMGNSPSNCKNAVDAMIVDTIKGIIADERSHLGFNFHKKLVADLRDEQWSDLNDGLQKISCQKLRERNQQFGNLLSEREMRSISRGENNWQVYARECLGFWYDKLGLSRDWLP